MFRLKMNLTSFTLGWLLTVSCVNAEHTFQTRNKNVENKCTIRIQLTSNADITCKIEEYGDIESLDKDADLDDTRPIESDGELEEVACTSSSQQKSQKSISVQQIEIQSHDYSTTTPQILPQNGTIKPALTKSLFPNIPPTINFIGEDEKVEQLPGHFRKLLKWRLGTNTWQVTRSCVRRVGFNITEPLPESHDWLGFFAEHSSKTLKPLRYYQKYNHFPGSKYIGRKDLLFRSLSFMRDTFSGFDFFPMTYYLPGDFERIKDAFKDRGISSDEKWIVKPNGYVGGRGIEVITKFSNELRRKHAVVQRYIDRPYLIDGLKFDLRIYVYVTSFEPLRLYLSEHGYLRFATKKYSTSNKDIGNKFIHLTNYSINKKNVDFVYNNNDTAGQGHKWSLIVLWNFLEEKKINTTGIWDSIKDIIIKTFISVETQINRKIKESGKSRYSLHELYGFDILLDENLIPWLLEVNTNPALRSNSKVDRTVNGGMIKDLLNIAGFRIPDKNDLVDDPSLASDLRHRSINMGPSNYKPSNKDCLDKRLFHQVLSPHEEAKQAFYTRIDQDEPLMQSIVDTLTPDDIRILTETIDEDKRKGGFQRLFPSPSSHKYLKYFETTRYYNLLIDQWIQRYDKMEAKGISWLQDLCNKKIHLNLNTNDLIHQVNVFRSCEAFNNGIHVDV